MLAPITFPQASETDGLTRTPPHNFEAEQALLGAILMNNRALERVSEFLRPEHFADPVHGRIYEACLGLTGRNQIATPVTLKTYLANDAGLKEMGGDGYLVRLAGAAATIINAADYGRLIFDLHLRRSLIGVGEDMVNDAFEADLERDAITQIEGAEQKLFELATTGQAEGGFQNFRTTLLSAISQAEAAHRREGKLSGVTSGLRDLDQKLGGLHPSDLLILAGRPSMGKAQPLDAKVLTATGWKRMGDLKLGEKLASVDGAPSMVSGLFPQGERPLFRVHFSDGRSTECCAEHLWRVRYRDWTAARTISTAELQVMLTRARYRNRLWIDLPSGHFGVDEALSIDPWMLGAVLGDGKLSGGSLVFSTASQEMLDRLGGRLGEHYRLAAAGGYDYRVVQAADHRRPGRQGVWPNPLKEHLVALGLWGLRSEDKFVPEIYLNASRSARLSVLQGLLDTDGWAESWGSVRFCTTSRQLAEDVVRLSRSLGGQCTIKVKKTYFRHAGERREGHPAFVCNLQHSKSEELFLLSDKRIRASQGGTRQKRLTVTAIEPTRTAPAQCISVTHPARLYITDDYIVTHNTALATNIAFAAAKALRYETSPTGEKKVAEGAVTAFFSLEMSAEQLATRILAERAEVPSHKIRQGELSHEEFERLVVVSQELHNLALYIDDTPALSVSAVRTRARRLARTQGLGMIVIDYLQLLTATPGKRVENRVQEVSDITRQLKALAKELSVPVLALSQLSRSVEQREDKRPQLSDLRESGSIEQDADVVMFVYREQYYLERAEPGRRADEAEEKFNTRHADWQKRCEEVWNTAEVVVAKQRHGPVGTVRLHFNGQYTRFADLDVWHGTEQSHE